MAEEKVIKIIVKKEGADASVKGLSKNIKKTGDETKSLNAGLTTMTGSAGRAFNALKSGLRTAVVGFKSLKFAIAATGIGLLIIGLVAVKKAFTNTEEGQNKFAKLMGVIGSITGNFIDLIAGLGEKIIEVFENPKKAIKDFWELIKTNIVNRFNGILELIPQMGKAIGLLFKGQWSEAAKVAANAQAKVLLGVENIVEKTQAATKATKEFIAELQREANIAAEIADQRAKADKIERALTVERAEAARDIAALRFKSEQRDKFSASERIKFLQEASKISEDISNKEIAANKLRLDAQIAENALSGSTKDDLNKVASLKAKGIQLDTAKLNLQKRLQTSLTTFQNEEKSGLKKIQDANQKIIDDEKKISDKKLEEEEKLRIKAVELEVKNEADRLEKIASIQDEFKKRREDEAAETEIQKLELNKERKLLELEELKATEQQKADIIAFYDDKINLKKKEEKEKEFNIDEEVENAKVSLKENTLSLIGSLAAKGSAVAKALAIREIVMEQQKSIAATISANTIANAKAVAASPLTGGQPFVAINTIQAGVGIAAGLATAVRSIRNITSGSSSPSGGSASGGGGGQSAPSFNLVEGTDSNQIAQGLNNQNANPVQSYVVGAAVTSQQELDANRIEIGSI